MMKLSYGIAALALLGCAAYSKATGPALSPAQVLSDAQSLEGKKVAVVGQLNVTPEWWTTSLSEGSGEGDKCLNLGGVEFLQKNKAALNGKQVSLPGIFRAEAFKGSLHGCETAAGLMTRNSDVKAAICTQFSQLPDCKP